jgi:Fe-S-cluster containining protein
MHVGNPPGYGGRLDGYGNWVWLTASVEDSERLQMMSAMLQDGLRLNADRGFSDQPCHWFDLATRRCGHYDQRPEACRMFEVGEDDCVTLRSHHGIAVLQGCSARMPEWINHLPPVAASGSARARC